MTSRLILVTLLFGGSAFAADDKAIEEIDELDIENETEPAVHIPEPMIFDLVRGLGAHRGELEINVLSQLPLNARKSRAFDWAPEIEYAIADGVGLELELPLKDGHIEAYKVAGQVTFSGLYRTRFLHGAQVIAEKYKGEDLVDLTALYIPVVRVTDNLSVMTMAGVRTTNLEEPTLLFNAAVFVEPTRASAGGFEVNVAAPRHEPATLLLMPQAYHEITNNWTIQAGVGAELGSDHRAHWTGALRLIWGTEGPPHPKTPKRTLTTRRR